MTRTVKLRFQRQHGEQTIEIKPAWAGKGIAIHKPISFDPDDDQPYFQQIQGLWRLSHINTGLALGGCMGSLQRAMGFARQWDAEFAALQAGEAMPPELIEAWKTVVEEMRTEPPRKPHLIVDFSQQPPLIRCLHCNAQEPVDLPMPVSVLAATERRWREQHLRCKPT